MPSQAMKQGAYDYLPKPMDLKRLRVLVQKALEFQAVVAENNELRSRLEKRSEPTPADGRERDHARRGAADRGSGARAT